MVMLPWVCENSPGFLQEWEMSVGEMGSLPVALVQTPLFPS